MDRVEITDCDPNIHSRRATLCAFVKMRELLASNEELARCFDQLEARVDKLIAHDEAIAAILWAIRDLTASPAPPPTRRPIGSTADLKE